MATVQQANTFIANFELHQAAKAARLAQAKATKRSYWGHIKAAHGGGYTPLSLTEFTGLSIAIITSNRAATVNRRSVVTI
jgi:hypothetical protein